MPLFTERRLAPLAAHEATDWLKPSFGEYLSAVAADAVQDMPAVAVPGMMELHEKQAEAHGIDFDNSDDMSIEYSVGSTKYMSVEDQAQRIKDAGLEKHVKPQEGYSSEMLDIILERKRGELQRAAVREAAPASWAPVGLGAGLGLALLDPINVASAFVPVVGEARALSILGRASGALGRAGARAGIGAVEGLAGAAMVEPIIAAARTQEQAEYGMATALANIAFGAAFGAALHPAAGAVGDWLRTRRGQRQPWAFVQPTPLTQELMDAHAREIYEARMAANPGADRVRVGQESQAAAALFDARSRAWAYDLGRTPEEYYAQNKPEYRAGEDVPEDALFHAADMSQAQDWASFISDARTGKNEFMLDPRTPDAAREFFNLPDLVTNGPANFVRHIDNNHPGTADSVVPKAGRVLAAADYITQTGSTRAGQRVPLYTAVRREGNKATAVVFWISASRKKGNRAILFDAYEGNAKSIDAMVAQKNAAAMASLSGESQHAGGTPSGPKPASGQNVLLESYDSPDGDIVSRLETKSNVAGEHARGAVLFRKDGRTVVQFFKAADFATAPHEMYHLFRREMERTAMLADAPARVREDWAKVLDFAGAEPGKAWTRAMEEKFARAGERFLLEGKAPTPELAAVFERLRQWFLEVFADADAAGMEISGNMRAVFGNMLTTPMAEGDRRFRYAVGSLLARSFAEDADTRLPAQPDLSGKPVETVRQLAGEAAQDLATQHEQFAQAHPDLAGRVATDYLEDVRAAEAEEARAVQEKAILDAIVECELRR